MPTTKDVEPTGTATLRRLLDERGVDWTSGDTKVSRNICTDFRPDVGVTISVWESGDGKLGIDAHTDYRFTPEQAIAATLGRGECHLLSALQYGDDCKECSACGAVFDEYMFKSGRCPSCRAKVVGRC